MKVSTKDLVLIEWVDSKGFHGWETIQTILDSCSMPPIYSVGWLMKKTRESVLIIPHISEGSGGSLQQGRGDLTIPRAAIKKTTVLRKAKNQ